MGLYTSFNNEELILALAKQIKIKIWFSLGSNVV